MAPHDFVPAFSPSWTVRVWIGPAKMVVMVSGVGSTSNSETTATS